MGTEEYREGKEGLVIQSTPHHLLNVVNVGMFGYSWNWVTGEDVW